MYGPKGPYMCPMYKYPIRQARFFIAATSMASKVADGLTECRDEDFWILRGAAITVATCRYFHCINAIY